MMALPKKFEVNAPSNVNIINAEIIPKPGMLKGKLPKLSGAKGENQPSTD